MKDEEELEWLKNLPKDWWKSGDTVCSVAYTLNRYGYFADKGQVISFFEKPWHYQRAIDELIEEFGNEE